MTADTRPMPRTSTVAAVDSAGGGFTITTTSDVAVARAAVLAAVADWFDSRVADVWGEPTISHLVPPLRVEAR